MELPGLLIGLFVGAVVVTTRLRKKPPIGSIELDGVRIDFPSMKMFEGRDEYVLRRTERGQWERRPVSLDAVAAAVGRRMETLSKQDHAASFEKGQAILKEITSGNPTDRAPTLEVARLMRTLAPGSEGRKALLEMLVSFVREASGQEEAEAALKGEKEVETLQATKEWLTENGGEVIALMARDCDDGGSVIWVERGKPESRNGRSLSIRRSGRCR